MSKITNIHAREILDSRGHPTVEAEVYTNSGVWSRAAVPSGASTGSHEARELRDGDKSRYLGRGVREAVAKIRTEIGPCLEGRLVSDLKKIDDSLILLDGTPNKSRLGSNGILAVSLACAKTAALEAGLPLYEFLNPKARTLPIPLMNVLNGGVHANNSLGVQEFMIVPHLETWSSCLQAGSEIFHQLKQHLTESNYTTSVGDEGGFAPLLQNNEQALEALCRAIEKSKYQLGEQVSIALDVASTEFYTNGVYLWEGQEKSAHQVVDIYKAWVAKYPLISIEDGLAEDDWEGWKHLTRELGTQVQLVGDDLFVTHPDRLQRGIKEKCANALLVKINQIGTLTETQTATGLAQEFSYQTIMSHRSGETEDTTISDLAVALNCSQIKTGSLCRSERVAKYNQLTRIEEKLGSRAQLARFSPSPPFFS